jgi:hypothetical protein
MSSLRYVQDDGAWLIVRERGRALGVMYQMRPREGIARPSTKV